MSTGWSNAAQLNLINFLIEEVEGHTFINIRNDQLGPVKYGVTQRKYNDICRRLPTHFELKSVEDLTKMDVVQYYLHFMDKEVKIHRFSNIKVLCVIFDIFCQHNNRTRGLILMKAVGIQGDYPGDHMIGPKVVNAIEQMDPDLFCDTALKLRE